MDAIQDGSHISPGTRRPDEHLGLRGVRNYGYPMLYNLEELPRRMPERSCGERESECFESSIIREVNVSKLA